MNLAELILSDSEDDDAWNAAVDAATPADVPAFLALADHEDPEVRRAVCEYLPLMFHGDPPSPEAVEVVIRLTRDPDMAVRDWACFALGTQWADDGVDGPVVRDALAARLEDVDDDARCEALFGLALRRDPRAMLRVRAALTRASGRVWFLEFRAAGALSDPSLHDLVLEHADGWPDKDAVAVEAVVRLTDPAGPGDDLVDGVASLYRDRAGEASETSGLAWWHRMDAMLDLAPQRAPEFLGLVLARLRVDPADAEAADLLATHSALAQMADDVEPEGTTGPDPG